MVWKRADTTLLGRETRFKGHIALRGELLVEARVIGSCDVDGSVSVSAEAVWQGDIRADTVIIDGRVEGNVLGRKKVQLMSTARVDGDVAARRIAMQPGAVVNGRMITRLDEIRALLTYQPETPPSDVSPRVPAPTENPPTEQVVAVGQRLRKRAKETEPA